MKTWTYTIQRTHTCRAFFVLGRMFAVQPCWPFFRRWKRHAR